VRSRTNAFRASRGHAAGLQLADEGNIGMVLRSARTRLRHGESRRFDSRGGTARWPKFSAGRKAAASASSPGRYDSRARGAIEPLKGYGPLVPARPAIRARGRQAEFPGRAHPATACRCRSGIVHRGRAADRLRPPMDLRPRGPFFRVGTCRRAAVAGKRRPARRARENGIDPSWPTQAYRTPRKGENVRLDRGPARAFARARSRPAAR